MEDLNPISESNNLLPEKKELAQVEILPGVNPVPLQNSEQFTDYFLQTNQGREKLDQVYKKFQGLADTNSIGVPKEVD